MRTENSKRRMQSKGATNMNAKESNNQTTEMQQPAIELMIQQMTRQLADLQTLLSQAQQESAPDEASQTSNNPQPSKEDVTGKAATAADSPLQQAQAFNQACQNLQAKIAQEVEENVRFLQQLKEESEQLLQQLPNIAGKKKVGGRRDTQQS